MNKIKNIICVLLFAVFVFGVSLTCIFKPADAFSDAERRELAQLPPADVQSVFDGTFMAGFESYTTDQFPAREWFRGIKALWNKSVFLKKDNNGLYSAQGHISKIDAMQNEEMMDYAAERFSYLYETYLRDTDTKTYFAIVPDKNRYLASQNGYPSLDYEAFSALMQEKTPYLQYIEIADLLSVEDYYTTDTHWRQENITDVAERLAAAMGADVKTSYMSCVLPIPFYGVYSGQYALPTKADTLGYLTNAVLENCTVTYYDAMGKATTGEMYNIEKAAGKDPYEMYLSGTQAIVQIENPSASQSRELVLFRDSFGSSIAPLLVQGYSKITLVDIRYIQSSFLNGFVDFGNADDVLFLYSTAILNQATSLR